MDQDVIAALVISAIGITLLFLALGLFYGLLALLTSVFKGQPASEGTAPAIPASQTADAELQAAAIGVALARAVAEQAPSLERNPSQGSASSAIGVSPWWALHHQRKVTQKPDSRRVP